MELKKINLSALNNTTGEKIIENEQENITENKSSVENSFAIENETQNNNKKKISFKTLIKSSQNVLNDSEVEKTNESVITDQSEAELPKTQPKISLKKLNEKVNEVADLNNITVEEEKVPKVEETKTISISDGDTICNMLTEEKEEIFANYKGSFTKEVKSKNEKEVKTFSKQSEKIDELNTTLESPEEVLNIIKEQTEIKETEEIIQTKAVESINSSEKTNLERYSESEKLLKNKQRKKVIGGVAGILGVIATGIFVTQLDFIAGDINKSENIPQKNIEIQKSDITEKIETIPEIENVEITDSIKTEDNQVLKTDIVKENDEIQVDNNEKSTKINEKLQNYLKEKYKSK